MNMKNQEVIMKIAEHLSWILDHPVYQGDEKYQRNIDFFLVMKYNKTE